MQNALSCKDSLKYHLRIIIFADAFLTTRNVYRGHLFKVASAPMFIDTPQVNGDLLTYQTEVGWPVSCLVTVVVSPLLALSSWNICQGGGLEPYLLLCCLGHKGPRWGFCLWESWHIALVAWHQLTQHSCPGHPTKTCLSLSGRSLQTMDILWLTDSPWYSKWHWANLSGRVRLIVNWVKKTPKGLILIL